MKIAIDVDEVLADTIQPIIDFYNKKLNASIVLDDEFSYTLYKNWNIELQKSIELVQDFFNEQILYIKPVEGSVDAISKLKEKGYELFIITARPENFRDLTIKWVEKNFGKNTFFDIICTDKFHNPNAPNKVEFLKQHGAALIVDDRVKTCEECLEEGFDAILFNMNNLYPWGKKNSDHMKKALNWEEVLSHIENIKEEKVIESQH